MTLISDEESNQQFCKIYAENYQWLSQWLARYLYSKHNLEDIVQDTFVKLFIAKTAHQIRQPKAYLASTARCIAMDQARHALVEQQYLQHLQHSTQDEANHSPEQQLIIIELLHRISLAVSDLPERARKCLLLYYLEGQSQPQIAQQLNISRRTVQLDLVKAMVHCHQWIEQQRR
jgi:RNA polymerase sigma factor (sigma-70 family)